MTKPDVDLAQTIIGIVAEIAEIPVEEVTPEKKLIDELEIDSLTMAETGVAIQDRFGVELTAEDLQHITTVQDLMDHLRHAGVTA